MSRFETCFARLEAEGRAGLVTFITAGDPDHETCRDLLLRLPGAGADIVELGMPFTDPMADGPSIQAASLRALRAGADMTRTLALARDFRAAHGDTPLVLMGYFNPIHAYGIAAFAEAAAEAGVDGLIVVDLPPEEDRTLREAAGAHGIAIIRLATPTTDAVRLPRVLEGASGFLYYVSVAGVTGTRSAGSAEIGRALAAIRKATELPIAVGFGIRTAAQVRAIAAHADAVVVGSAIVEAIAARLDAEGRAREGLVDDVAGFVADLASGLVAKGA